MRWLPALSAVVADISNHPAKLMRYGHFSKYDACRGPAREMGTLTDVSTTGHGGTCLAFSGSGGSLEFDCVEHPSISLPGKPVASIRHRNSQSCVGQVHNLSNVLFMTFSF